MDENGLNIAIVGAGRLGSVLGLRWLAQGYGVCWIVPEASVSKHASLAAKPGARVTDAGGIEGTFDALVLATPWSSAVEALRSVEFPPGTPLIDCTNPVAFGADGLHRETLEEGSVAARLATRFPDYAVVKTLNQVGSDVVEDPGRFPTPPLMFLAGDDEATKKGVATLVAVLGFDVRDAGGLANASALEALAFLWMNEAMRSESGRHQTFAVQTPGASPASPTVASGTRH